MKTFAEQVAALKATREAKQEELKAVAQKSIDEQRSMDTAEAEQFDTLEAEIKRLDDDIARLSRLAEIDKQTAKAVSTEGREETPIHKSVGTAPVQVKNTEKLEPGVAFARIARCKALSRLENVSPVDIAKTLYPGDDRLVSGLVSKTGVGAANTITGNETWAGNLINEGGAAFADFVEFLRPRTLLGRIEGRLRRIPFDTPVLVQGSSGSASWVAEGKAKPVTSWTYTRAKMEPLKVAAIAAATEEQLRRASVAADQLLRDELARAVAARLDTDFIDPDKAAVSGESPASVLNGVAALTGTGDTDADGVRGDIEIFLNAFAGANQSLAGAFWVMPERIAIALSLMQNPLGQASFPGMNFDGGTFFGLPVFVTNYAETTTLGSVVALIKGDEIFLGDEGGVSISMSDQASILMDDDPSSSMDSTTPTGSASLVSMWQTNSVAFRVERIINWQRRRAESVAWMRVNWSSYSGTGN